MTINEVEMVAGGVVESRQQASKGEGKQWF